MNLQYKFLAILNSLFSNEECYLYKLITAHYNNNNSHVIKIINDYNIIWMGIYECVRKERLAIFSFFNFYHFNSSISSMGISGASFFIPHHFNPPNIESISGGFDMNILTS